MLQPGEDRSSVVVEDDDLNVQWLLACSLQQGHGIVCEGQVAQDDAHWSAGAHRNPHGGAHGSIDPGKAPVGIRLRRDGSRGSMSVETSNDVGGTDDQGRCGLLGGRLPDGCADGLLDARGDTFSISSLPPLHPRLVTLRDVELHGQMNGAGDTGDIRPPRTIGEHGDSWTGQETRHRSGEGRVPQHEHPLHL